MKTLPDTSKVDLSAVQAYEEALQRVLLNRELEAWKSLGTIGFDAYRAWILDSSDQKSE